jgi:hypothetical protein
MKIRAELHLNHEVSRVILAPKPEEKVDHLALKLAAFAMFHTYSPIVDPSAAHPSFGNIDVRPDLVGLDEGGDIILWLECGPTSINKLDKAARRLPRARVIVVMASQREAQQLRDRLEKEFKHSARIEIWIFPEGTFLPWVNALSEKTELFGEAHEKSLNLVVNEMAMNVEFLSV